ncbi:unnamed protein product [Protopolystoma xenopodis]|uniref:Uncharacterized protein n=1 Tax=Protopolystoma xenopodis TaxID=117903 RepID=A0A3S5AM58_9PLAT|nr:unnamed protein product [Protopolystoma xenopodis]
MHSRTCTYEASFSYALEAHRFELMPYRNFVSTSQIRVSGGKKNKKSVEHTSNGSVTARLGPALPCSFHCTREHLS